MVLEVAPVSTMAASRGGTPSSSRIGLFFMALGGLLALWEGAGRLAPIPAYVLPLPSEVVGAIILHYDLLFRHMRVTLAEMVSGFALALAAGTLLGVPLAHSSKTRAVVLPLLMAFEGLPKLAFAPLVVVWLGTGISSKAVLAASLALFPIVVQLTRGLRAVEESVDLFVRALRAPPWRVFWRIRLPAALPALFDGVRLAVPAAAIGAIIGEFISSQAGLGFIILLAIGDFNLPLAFAALACIALITGVLSPLIMLLEERFLRWMPPLQQ